MAEYVEEGAEGKAWVEEWLAPLGQAVARAGSWLADRYRLREALIIDFEQIVEALVAAIQVWQDFENTSPLNRHDPAAAASVWLGERRTRALRELDARIDHLYRDAVTLAGLPTPETGDHVLLSAAGQCLQRQPEDPGGYAARVAIRRLNDKAVRVRLLTQDLISA